MRRQGLVPVLIAILAVAPIAAAQSGPLARANWLAGCWELRAPNRVTLEMWMPALGDMMLGASRTTVGAATSEYEQLRLRVDGSRLVYTSMPSRQKEASFPSIEVTDTTLVFENTAHDFPQRIIYRRRGADSILARIEGPGPSGTRGVNFPMRRSNCLTVAPPTAPMAADGSKPRNVSNHPANDVPFGWSAEASPSSSRRRVTEGPVMCTG